jgi:hypothetical protein
MRNALRSIAYRLTTTTEQRRDDATTTLLLMASGRLPAFRTYGDVLDLVRPFGRDAVAVVTFGLELGSPAYRDPAALLRILSAY